MDAVFFASKRAHYAGVAFMRPLLREFGITPARFDLLSALDPLPRPTQMALRELLGVARSTVSEMIAPLEEAGLVKRKPCSWDMRTKIVELTALGRAILQRVRERWTDSGDVTVAVDSCLEFSLSWPGGTTLRGGFIALAGALRERFGRGRVPPAYGLTRQEVAAGLADFEDEPDVPWLDETL